MMYRLMGKMKKSGDFCYFKYRRIGGMDSGMPNAPPDFCGTAGASDAGGWRGFSVRLNRTLFLDRLGEPALYGTAVYFNDSRDFLR